MIRLVTFDDIVESYCKIHQRGLAYLFSKFNYNPIERIKSTFNVNHVDHANWWIIPSVRKRWNTIVSGAPEIIYEDYVVEKYFKNRKGLKLLSLGSGVCSHEIAFARHNCFEEVVCMDIANHLLDKAKKTAESQGLKNMSFLVADVNSVKLPEESYDVILFHAALHHFKDVKDLIGDKVKRLLKDDGFLVINDYVGPPRLQWTKDQLKETNRILKDIIPVHYRKRFKTNLTKSNVSGPGYLRMLVTDPSEAVESDKILPAIHENFETIEVKPLGGNILTLLFKDISHNFIDNTEETRDLLQELFRLEDEFLKDHLSDNIFGVYKKK